MADPTQGFGSHDNSWGPDGEYTKMAVKQKISNYPAHKIPETTLKGFLPQMYVAKGISDADTNPGNEPGPEDLK